MKTLEEIRKYKREWYRRNKHKAKLDMSLEQFTSFINRVYKHLSNKGIIC